MPKKVGSTVLTVTKHTKPPPPPPPTPHGRSHTVVSSQNYASSTETLPLQAMGQADEAMEQAHENAESSTMLEDRSTDKVNVSHFGQGLRTVVLCFLQIHV